MKKFLSGFLVLPILFVFFPLSALSVLEKHEVKNQTVRQKRSTDFKIKETDFINTMFLRSSFFENGTDTNYFVNPTLKTSKLLTYNKDGYLDFLKDSYATGIVFDKPSDKFLELYNNGDNYVKQYNLNQFYNVDKKFFLKDLTNFMYTYFGKYNDLVRVKKMQQSINNLEQVKFNEDNGKLMIKGKNEEINNTLKTYIGLKLIGKIGFLNKGKGQQLKLDTGKIFGYKDIYRGDGNGEPIIPTINKETGEITDGEFGSEYNFISQIVDEVIKENIRVQQGGSSNYDKLDEYGTQKIIFDFEIIDAIEKDKIKKVVYRMILTINQAQEILSGNISLKNYFGKQFEAEKLNFDFDFIATDLKDKEQKLLGNFKISNYFYRDNNKIVLKELDGLIYIKQFFKQFFSNALMPVFTNRSAFMEASYLDFLTYDTVVVNFLGLKADNFYNVVSSQNYSYEYDKNNFSIRGVNILNSTFKIMNDFYKNYLRTIFDLENETYIQGYNKKFGLLISNGFKIYPQYFYFSDKYQNLDVKIYSSHANKFYQTKYGKVFNFDYSVGNSFNVNDKASYLFDGEQRKKYGLRVKDLSIQKIGYGVFELQAQKENEFYSYYDFNFGIYNGKDLTSLVDKPTGQGGNEYMQNCKGYDMVCHLKNGAIGIVNNIPGVKQANELASGIGKLFQTIYNFFSKTFEIGKFDPNLYIVITNTFLLIIFMKFIRMF